MARGAGRGARGAAPARRARGRGPAGRDVAAARGGRGAGLRAGHRVRHRRGRHDGARRTTPTSTIDDPFASSAHARIFPRGDFMHVEDMGSTNGTYLNGRPAARRRAAQGGGRDPDRRQRIPLRGVGDGPARRRAGRADRRRAPARGQRGQLRDRARRCSRWPTAWAARRPGEVASRTAAKVFEARRRATAARPSSGSPELAREANRQIFEMAQARRVAARDGHDARPRRWSRATA